MSGGSPTFSQVWPSVWAGHDHELAIDGASAVVVLGPGGRESRRIALAEDALKGGPVTALPVP